jgi:hypothetical protein
VSRGMPMGMQQQAMSIQQVFGTFEIVNFR